MRLTRKKAIELCILLWTWLAKTGKMKEDWPEWGKYQALHHCWFCEYGSQKDESLCDSCPLVGEGDVRCNSLYFGEWKEAETDKGRKKYAGLFLEQIKSLRT